jgi:hypothetical protein
MPRAAMPKAVSPNPATTLAVKRASIVHIPQPVPFVFNPIGQQQGEKTVNICSVSEI